MLLPFLFSLAVLRLWGTGLHHVWWNTHRNTDAICMCSEAAKNPAGTCIQARKGMKQRREYGMKQWKECGSQPNREQEATGLSNPLPHTLPTEHGSQAAGERFWKLCLRQCPWSEICTVPLVINFCQLSIMKIYWLSWQTCAYTIDISNFPLMWGIKV